MRKYHPLVATAASFLLVHPIMACEPVVPFMQAMEPTLALSGSLVVLAMAVALKSILFALFERRLPRLVAAWRMFLGNVLTSVVGLLVAVMMASAPVAWIVTVPLVFVVCWLPTRRLVKVAPIPGLARMSAGILAAFMSLTMLASCILFMAGRGALEAHRTSVYWAIKVAAIFLALLASLTLTTVWEEWAIWRRSSSPKGVGYFPTVLRANLYVLLFVMAVPAALILPKRIHSPDFLAPETHKAASNNLVVSR